jgi:hypothetical protein
MKILNFIIATSLILSIYSCEKDNDNIKVTYPPIGSTFKDASLCEDLSITFLDSTNVRYSYNDLTGGIKNDTAKYTFRNDTLRIINTEDKNEQNNITDKLYFNGFKGVFVNQNTIVADFYFAEHKDNGKYATKIYGDSNTWKLIKR